MHLARPSSHSNDKPLREVSNRPCACKVFQGEPSPASTAAGHWLRVVRQRQRPAAPAHTRGRAPAARSCSSRRRSRNCHAQSTAVAGARRSAPAAPRVPAGLAAGQYQSRIATPDRAARLRQLHAGASDRASSSCQPLRRRKHDRRRRPRPAQGPPRASAASDVTAGAAAAIGYSFGGNCNTMLPSQPSARRVRRACCTTTRAALRAWPSHCASNCGATPVSVTVDPVAGAAELRACLPRRCCSDGLRVFARRRRAAPAAAPAVRCACAARAAWTAAAGRVAPAASAPNAVCRAPAPCARPQTSAPAPPTARATPAAARARRAATRPRATSTRIRHGRLRHASPADRRPVWQPIALAPAGCRARRRAPDRPTPGPCRASSPEP